MSILHLGATLEVVAGRPPQRSRYSQLVRTAGQWGSPNSFHRGVEIHPNVDQSVGALCTSREDTFAISNGATHRQIPDSIGRINILI